MGLERDKEQSEEQSATREVTRNFASAELFKILPTALLWATGIARWAEPTDKRTPAGSRVIMLFKLKKKKKDPVEHQHNNQLKNSGVFIGDGVEKTV